MKLFITSILFFPLTITNAANECASCTSSQQCYTVASPAQSVTDADCAPCAPSTSTAGAGQTWWPCATDQMCECRVPGEGPTASPIPATGLTSSPDSVCGTFFSESQFNTLAPNAQSPYTYPGFCDAIAIWNTAHPEEKIFGMGSLAQRKGELAAFLGNTLHESGDFQAGREYIPCGDRITVANKVYCKPCDNAHYNWGTHTCNPSKLQNGGTFDDYCNSAQTFPQSCNCGPVSQTDDANVPAGYMDASKAFFGRGAIQLSWNYNYIKASVSLTGSANTFCDNPDLVATVAKYAWGAGIYFWMESTKATMSTTLTCHQASLVGNGNGGDFGGGLDVINGGQECPTHSTFHASAIIMRTNRYCRAATVVRVSSLLSFGGCEGLQATYKSCDTTKTMENGGCPDCAAYRNVNCEGSWSSTCSSSCEETFSVTVAQSGTGSSCSAINGETRSCTGGNCAPPVNCVSGWSSCDANCQKTWTVTTVASNGGNACPSTSNTIEACTGGECASDEGVPTPAPSPEAAAEAVGITSMGKQRNMLTGGIFGVMVVVMVFYIV